MDLSVLIAIVPPIITALFAYLIARKRNILTEKINRAKMDADAQVQALTIVRGIINDLRGEWQESNNRCLHELEKTKEEFKQQITELRNENEKLTEKIKENEELIISLRSEIVTLRKTLALYEEEIARLKKSGGYEV